MLTVGSWGFSYGFHTLILQFGDINTKPLLPFLTPPSHFLYHIHKGPHFTFIRLWPYEKGQKEPFPPFPPQDTIRSDHLSAGREFTAGYEPAGTWLEIFSLWNCDNKVCCFPSWPTWHFQSNLRRQRPQKTDAAR